MTKFVSRTARFLAAAGGILLIIIYMLIPITALVAVLIGIQLCAGTPTVIPNLAPLQNGHQQLIAVILLIPTTLFLIVVELAAIVFGTIVCLALNEASHKELQKNCLGLN